MQGGRWRIAVMGAGAVGGYFGAKLTAAGHEVMFIARGEHLAAMKRDGLKIKSIQGDFAVSSVFTEEPEAIGPVDLVLFAVKSYDTETASASLAPLITENTMILSLQNGVDNADKVAARWGKEKTLGGVAYIGARICSPGVVEHSAAGRIVLGRLNGESSALRELETLFTEAQIPCATTPNIGEVMWKKLAWNAPFCANACLTRTTVKEILDSDNLRKLALQCLAEVREAARLQDLELADSIVAETMELTRGLGAFKPSMLQDLEAKKPLEYEAFNGIVVRLLERDGKPAPVNRVFYSTLKFLDDQIRSKTTLG